MSDRPLPTIVVTGASGFIGRHFLEVAREHYRIFALARRSQKDAGVPPHHNIRWLMVDIADSARLGESFDEMAAAGGADFLLHLAGFYRFDRMKDPEYQRTNVEGTRNVLEQGGRLQIRRCVFASSITVTEFRGRKTIVDERSPADATFAYARSKAEGEAMIREYSKKFAGSVVRLAAVFSDWGEYGPLYMLLSNWFGGRWCSRILPGRGLAAIPYVHISYVVELFLKIFEMSDRLERFDTYVASPSQPVSQRDLFELATSYYFGRPRKPLLFPRPLACLGLMCRNTVRSVAGAPRPERLWMLRYVDHVLRVDPTHTQEVLPVRQRRRLHLHRRIAFIVENSKNYPLEWRSRNEAVIRKTRERPELIVSEAMRTRSDEIVNRIAIAVSADERLPSYQAMDPDRLRWYVRLLYQMLMHAAGTGDRTPILDHAEYLGNVRKLEGFDAREVKTALRIGGRVVVDALLQDPTLGRYRQLVRDAVELSIEPACDEIDDAYEGKGGVPVIRRVPDPGKTTTNPPDDSSNGPRAATAGGGEIQ